jgi:hypothetical protein
MGTTHHSRIAVCVVIAALAGPSAIPGCEKSKENQSKENGGSQSDIEKWAKELWGKTRAEEEPTGGEPVESPEEIAPARLSSEQIRAALEARFAGAKDPRQARRYLDLGRDLATHTGTPGNQYKALKCFKLHLAHQGAGHPTFQEPADQRQYEELLRNLSAQITELYKQACVCEQRRDWLTARDYFSGILKMVPAKEEPYPEPKNALFDNLVAHLEYVNRLLDARKEP